MPGVVTKTTVFRYPFRIYRLGGVRLIVAALMAKPGTPFLTVMIKTGSI